MRWLKMAGGGGFAFFAGLAGVIGISKDGVSAPTVLACVFLAGCAYFGVRVALDAARQPTREHRAKLLEQLDKTDLAAPAAEASGEVDADADAKRRAAAHNRERT